MSGKHRAPRRHPVVRRAGTVGSVTTLAATLSATLSPSAPPSTVSAPEADASSTTQPLRVTPAVSERLYEPNAALRPTTRRVSRPRVREPDAVAPRVIHRPTPVAAPVAHPTPQLTPVSHVSTASVHAVPAPPVAQRPVGSSVGARALAAAETRAGMRYVWGATGPTTFDCSGLVLWAFRQVGVNLPRTAAAQAQVGTPVSRAQLQPGDPVFFYSPISHVGIYAGNGLFFNASTEGVPLGMSRVDNEPFVKGMRISG